jgi:hypothetical protein
VALASWPMNKPISSVPQLRDRYHLFLLLRSSPQARGRWYKLSTLDQVSHQFPRFCLFGSTMGDEARPRRNIAGKGRNDMLESITMLAGLNSPWVQRRCRRIIRRRRASPTRLS